MLISFLNEDAPSGDITSESVVENELCRARIIARQEGVVAGLDEAAILFDAQGVSMEISVKDGSEVDRGTILASLGGHARSILFVERTALNIIGRMSGIASMTHRIQSVLDRIQPGCKIASTRKTAPGLRLLDKKAVVLGGGYAHRITLSDGVMIKDNHLILVPLETAIHRARAHIIKKKIEVEVETPEEALVAARAGADILLLDNMSPGILKKTLSLLKEADLREFPTIEVSGGITEQNIPNYALLGVDYISMGAITHSVRNFDVSLEIIRD
ncbi:MAG: nicotinate-nucleotide pyrophosphorylase [Methanoregulaceae archaeon PtaB.Bin108]|jgi:nicotinate-nucleotide pyrophosphorylase (carboxylating)|nr:MAG: nicotinate-nucleotide pyrophosphorylase [Methanoregulaceae archaeon PtaB.Bin108]